MVSSPVEETYFLTFNLSKTNMKRHRLGWDDNLEPAAKEFAKVVKLAGEGKKIRGFATNVSNYNRFTADVRANYTEGSNSYDENHYTLSLAPFLEAEGLVSTTTTAVIYKLLTTHPHSRASSSWTRAGRNARVLGPSGASGATSPPPASVVRRAAPLATTRT